MVDIGAFGYGGLGLGERGVIGAGVRVRALKICWDGIEE